MLAPAAPQTPRSRRLPAAGMLSEPWQVMDPADLASEAGSDGALTVIHVDQVGQVEAQRRVEAWVMGGPLDRDAQSDVIFRGLRVLMRGPRAALFGPADLTEAACVALWAYADMRARVLRLETDLSARLASVSGDATLTHGVDRRALRHQARINDMTRWATLLHLDHADLMRDLRRPGERQGLDLSARRILGELSLQADLLGRVENLEDTLEQVHDLYDTANDRLLEFRYFRTEVLLETLILVVLLAELLFTVLNLF